MNTTQFDFDQVVAKQGHHSVKHDANLAKFGRADIQPLWVADMDFAVAPSIQQALQQRCDYPIFGYTTYPDALFEGLIRWFKTRHHWQFNPQDVLMVGGVVTAIHACVLALTQVGDKVIIQTPVYPPFYDAVNLTGRQLLCNPLKKQGQHYQIDFEQFEDCAKQGAKLFILCSPHNPVGRVWTKAELQQLLQICRKYAIAIISDEIHADLVYSDAKHTPLARLANADDVIITTVAPSKTFNIAGLMLSSMIISHAATREKIKQQLARTHLGSASPLSIVAFETAYREGVNWLDQLLPYLEQNRNMLVDYFHQHCPQIQLNPIEGTYLAWLDFSQFGLDEQQLNQRLIEQAKVGLNFGLDFGQQGALHRRLNFALPRAKLIQALEKISHAFC